MALITVVFFALVHGGHVDDVLLMVSAYFFAAKRNYVVENSEKTSVGVAMYTVCSLLDTPIVEYIKESLPFLLAIFVLILVLLFVPSIVLFLPNLVFG